METGTEAAPETATPYFPERWISTVKDETLEEWKEDLERKIAGIEAGIGRLRTGIDQVEAEQRRRAETKAGRNGQKKA